MKKYFYFLAIAVLFAACQNNQNEELGTPFQKGQKVTLSATIANPNGGAKQMPGKQRVSGEDKGTEVKLTWNTGDQIKVTVDGKDATFTLIGEGGSNTGEFEGTMPADGTNYTVTYPVDAVDLTTTTQTYVPNGFGDELMAMSGSGTLDGGFTLEAQNALLGFQLKGKRTVKQVVVTNPDNNETYTLNCGDGVALDPEKATLFYIVVPAGEWSQGFSIDVTYLESIDAAGKEFTNNFTKISAATFTANQAMIMPEQEVYILKTLTFEDWTNPADKSFDPYELQYDEYFTIEKWSDLIDKTQNGNGSFQGGLLYGSWDNSSLDFYPADWSDPNSRYANCYCWYDEYNTKLCNAFGYFGSGGMAISNYVEQKGYNQDYSKQLTAYAPAASNFCMVHTGGSSWGGDPETFENYFTFGDGIARVIDHMYVANCVLPIGELDYDPTGRLTITAKGIIIDEYDEETVSAELEFTLIENGEPIIEDWTKWNLSKLGKVNKVRFICNPSGEYGFDNLSAPQFAFDDIAVRFPEE